METYLFFISGLALGVAITYFYYDARIQRLHTLLVQIKASGRENNTWSEKSETRNDEEA